MKKKLDSLKAHAVAQMVTMVLIRRFLIGFTTHCCILFSLKYHIAFFGLYSLLKHVQEIDSGHVQDYFNVQDSFNFYESNTQEKTKTIKKIGIGSK